jgi:hypothetical protein
MPELIVADGFRSLPFWTLEYHTSDAYSNDPFIMDRAQPARLERARYYGVVHLYVIQEWTLEQVQQSSSERLPPFRLDLP